MSEEEDDLIEQVRRSLKERSELESKRAARRRVEQSHKRRLLDGVKWAACFGIDDGDPRGSFAPGWARVCHHAGRVVRRYASDLDLRQIEIPDTDEGRIARKVIEMSVDCADRTAIANFLIPAFDVLNEAHVPMGRHPARDIREAFLSMHEELLRRYEPKRPEPKARPKRKPVPSRRALTDFALTDREVLVEMLKLEALSKDSRAPASAIAAKVFGTADENLVKKAISRLKSAGMIASKEGRGGGSWLTAKGQQAAKELDEKQ